ncbi:hypothetical protein MT390_19435 [Vibrio sp. 2-Bac 85]
MKKIFILAVLPSMFLTNSVFSENAYDMNGDPITVDTSSFYKDEVTGKIYSQDGNVYITKGEYESIDRHGNTIIKDCSQAMLFTDPNVVPDVPVGSLPGDECYFQQINYDEDGSSYEKPTIPFKNEVLLEESTTSMTRASTCTRFSGYAPPFKWSVPVPVVSHIGYTTYTITIKVKGSTDVNSWARYWGTNERWHDRKFMDSTTISTGSAASSVYMTYLGIPYGSSISGTAC